MLSLLKNILSAFVFTFVVGGCGLIEHSLRANHTVQDTVKPETLHTQTNTTLQPIIQKTKEVEKIVAVKDTIQSLEGKGLRYYAEAANRQRDSMFRLIFNLQKEVAAFQNSQTSFNNGQGASNDKLLAAILARQNIVLKNENKSLKQENKDGSEAIKSQNTIRTLYFIVACLSVSFCIAMKMWLAEVKKNNRRHYEFGG